MLRGTALRGTALHGTALHGAALRTAPPSAVPAPAATPAGTRSGASALARGTTGLRRPKAKSAANAITASEYSTTATIRK